MTLAMARTVRRGVRTDPELAQAAAGLELEMQRRLEVGDNVIPLAANFAQRSEDPGEPGGKGATS